MYKSFTVRNYRCFADLTIEPLERINLIAGKNNVGKTALLEALWLHQGYYNPSLGMNVSALRGLEQTREEFLWDLFLEFDPKKTIELLSQDLSDRSRSLHITIREQSTSHVLLRAGEQASKNSLEFSSTKAIGQETTEPIESQVLWNYTGPSGETIQAYALVEQDRVRIERPPGVREPNGVFAAVRGPDNLEALAGQFSHLAVAKQESKIIQTLQIIEPRLRSLTVQHRSGVPIIYGDIDASRLVPLPLMGEGIGRLLGMALSISNAQKGILLIDEIENGLHHTVMGQVWQAIARLAREYDVQIFAATHSEECIRAAHQAFAADEVYDFALHRLEWVKGAIRAVTYDQETLDAAIEIDAEVR